MKKAEGEIKYRGRSKTYKAAAKIIKQPSTLASPYSRPLGKTRSVSNSKSVPLLKPTFIVSSLKGLFQDSQASASDKKLTYRSSLTDVKTSSFDEDFETKFTRELRNAKSPDEEFEVCRFAFEEVVHANKGFAKILTAIKSVYDFRLESGEQKAVALKAENKDLQHRISKCQQDRQLFTKKTEKLAQENFNLSKQLDEAEEKFNSVVEKLKEIKQFDLANVPKDEIIWKGLVAENQSLKKYIKTLQCDYKLISTKEKSLINLLVELNKRGYPVEEVFKQIKGDSTKEADESLSDNTENEALVSDRGENSSKPDFVPLLSFRGLNLNDCQSDSLIINTG